MNQLISIRQFYKVWLETAANHGWFSPMFIDNQYDYDREEFDWE